MAGKTRRVMKKARGEEEEEVGQIKDSKILVKKHIILIIIMEQVVQGKEHTVEEVEQRNLTKARFNAMCVIAMSILQMSVGTIRALIMTMKKPTLP